MWCGGKGRGPKLRELSTQHPALRVGRPGLHQAMGKEAVGDLVAGLWHPCYTVLRRTGNLGVPLRLEATVSKCGEWRGQAQSPLLMRMDGVGRRR